MRHLTQDDLPGFVTPDAVIWSAVGSLRPPSRINIAEAAEKWRELRNPAGGYSGEWRNDFAPYLVEPMVSLSWRDTLKMFILGPSQFGKTEILLNLILHCAAESGSDLLVLQPDITLAEDFSERRVDRMFQATKKLRALIGPSRSDDKRLSKLFRNGARLSIGWPVSSQLASRPVPIVAVDEVDSIREDIGRDEGDVITLAEGRTASFGRHARVVGMSTPKRQDGKGIVGHWMSGDRRLWHWPCAECGEYWTPGFDQKRKPSLECLHVRPEWNEERARAEAALICPHCGALLREGQKAWMNARGLWLPEGATITAEGVIGGTPRRGTTRSYWFSGLAARQRSWADIAANYVAALRLATEQQDERQLKTFWNTQIGAPYRSILAGADPIEPEALKARAEDLDLGVVPAWAGFVTAAVDVQGNRFDCMAIAWGPDNRAQVIGHWQIIKTLDPVTGEECALEPFRRADDWDLLTDQVLNRVWRAEEGAEYRAEMVGVDTGGGDGSTGQSYEWWHRVWGKDPSAARRIMLLKGDGRRDAPLINVRKIEHDSRGRPLRRGIVMHHINTEVMKDQMDLRLRMARAGTGWVHLPRGLPERFWLEATAEARGQERWEKQRTRNEAWDLLVYNLAAWHQLRGPRVNWEAPPAWAVPRRPLPLEQLATQLKAVAQAVAPAKPTPPPAPPAPGIPGRSRYWKGRRPMTGMYGGL